MPAATAPAQWPLAAATKSIAPVTRPDSTAALRQQLAEAIDAARDAYRHTTGLIRLLAVIGQPGSPERLIDETLTVLSEVFSADITCVARPLDRRLLVLACCGLPEDDRALRDGWPLEPALRRRLARPGRALAPVGTATGDGPVPRLFATLGARAAVWQPYGRDGGEDLLVLLRHTADPFTPVDLEVLGSVAGRLQVAVAERERAAAVEQLAQSGHLLARHLDLDPLLTEAVNLLRSLLGAEDTWVAIVEASAEGLTASVRATAGPRAPDATTSPAESLPGWAVMHDGRPYVDNDGKEPPGRALLGVPVMGETLPAAVLYAARDRSHPFRPDAADIAVIFANYLWVAMTNAELHRALRRSEATLRERATHDPLTGLANRVLAGQRLEEALGCHTDDHVGLLFCDLDGFKSVNDRFGHEAGDHLLQQVAARLRAGTRPGDLPARFGGDEFVVVLDGVTGVDQVTALAEAMLRSLEPPFAVAGRSVRISASIGGAVGERGRSTAAAMMRDADAAMFIAKERGPGQVEVVPTP